MMTVARATDTEVFPAFLEQVLLPALKERPHPIVVLDRLASHRSPQVRAAFEAAGVEVRFRPAYSPDFNPIEPCGSKIKTALRSAAARTWKPWKTRCPVFSTPSQLPMPTAGSVTAATKPHSSSFQKQQELALG